jgi:hypothetical protein
VVYEFSVINKKLHASTGNIEPVEISPFGTDQFSYGGFVVRFRRTGNLISGFELEGNGVYKLKFEKER